jgi:hypothetical protein
MLRSLALLGAVLGNVWATGCTAARQHFIPREDVRAQSPRGWPSAQYAVSIGGQTAGEAKVWSEGASVVDDDADDDRTILHVGFEIENRTDGELDFDVDRCRVIDAVIDDGQISDLGARDESGKLHVAAGQVGLIDLEFVLPRDTRPRDLRSFRVDWTLANASGTYKQSTPFRVDTARYYRPRAYYYDYDPWWGFGTGFAVGHVSSRFWWGPRWHWHHWCW